MSEKSSKKPTTPLGSPLFLFRFSYPICSERKRNRRRKREKNSQLKVNSIFPTHLDVGCCESYFDAKKCTLSARCYNPLNAVEIPSSSSLNIRRVHTEDPPPQDRYKRTRSSEVHEGIPGYFCEFDPMANSTTNDSILASSLPCTLLNEQLL